MATIVNTFTSKPTGFKKWAEASMIGIGLLAVLVLMMALYLGLAF